MLFNVNSSVCLSSGKKKNEIVLHTQRVTQGVLNLVDMFPVFLCLTVIIGPL